MTSTAYYADQKISLEQIQKKQIQKKNLLAWLRLFCVATILAISFFLRSWGWVMIGPVDILLLFIFVKLVYMDLSNKEALSHTGILIGVNDDELKALAHQYGHFKDGEEHKPKEHYYANDLDIFGHASLFQFLNRTVSELGSLQLANWLLHPADMDQIGSRQEAVKELSQKISWIQQMQATGKATPVKINTQKRLENWLSEEEAFTNRTHWKWLRIVLPIVSVCVTSGYIFDLLPTNIFYYTMLAIAIMAFSQEKKIGLLHNHLSKMAEEIGSLSRSIERIENEQFESPLLSEMQQSYKNGSQSASSQIKSLKKILDRLDLRFNIVLAVPLNLLLLWNVQQILQLEKWKRKHQADVSKWLDLLGVYEALMSFAVIHYNNPDWCFPDFKEDHFYLEAGNLGHPLIAKSKRVNNLVSITHKASIMLVTGSNMAGKSTYLRSTGINIVLAMAGSPVCASRFTLSPVQLISSMRIADNLEESTSTFYAELKKLKTVIDKVNQNERVFILLDEILRGTNSLDRHTGSEALIKQLIKKEAAAILATHDTDLASMEKDYPDNVLNFHFDAQVNGEELYFDYLLKPGVCRSLNASILMRKIGIELEK